MLGIILGTGPGMFSDLGRALCLAPRARIIAVNGAGVLYRDRIALWVSIHGDHLEAFIDERERLGYPDGYAAWGNFGSRHQNRRAHRWDKPNGGGSSALLALEVSREVAGYTHWILCGVPLSGHECKAWANADGEIMGQQDASKRQTDRREAEVLDSREPSRGGYLIYRKGWKQQRRQLAPFVRSMSGWTLETFGAPTHEWVDRADSSCGGSA